METGIVEIGFGILMLILLCRHNVCFAEHNSTANFILATKSFPGLHGVWVVGKNKELPHQNSTYFSGTINSSLSGGEV
jgi:hypothetical protein